MKFLVVFAFVTLAVSDIRVNKELTKKKIILIKHSIALIKIIFNIYNE